MKIGDTQAAQEPPGGVFPGVDALGAYHLLRPLATGGMARIWLAVDGRDGREVAVKRMLSSLSHDAELCKAFLDEGVLGTRLRHPHIVETLELGEAVTASGNEPYLVLELLRGRPLIEVLRTAARLRRPVPVAFAMRAIRDAALGLAHAHALTDDAGRPLGVVHRDVTPHNLFVCASGTIKVLDFGIAKASSQQHRTKAGVIKGKFAYLSPEQIRGLAPDARIDVWALGIVLYELLTGKPLFRGSNDGETLHRILQQELPAPEKLRPEVPAALGALALRALQRDRDRRLPSAAAMAQSLEAIAIAEGIPQRPATVRDFVAELFPKDATEHEVDRELARRTYAHLSSSSLNALAGPWMTPAQGLAAAPRSLLAKAAMFTGAVGVTAAAAVGTATFMTRHTLAPPATVIVAAPAAVAKPVELPGAPMAEPTLPRPPSHHLSVSPKAPRPHGQGSVRLAAQPWAVVWVDGRALGTTPLPAQKLADGAHTIVFKNDQLGVSVKRRITVVADKDSLVAVDLFAEKKK